MKREEGMRNLVKVCVKVVCGERCVESGVWRVVWGAACASTSDTFTSKSILLVLSKAFKALRALRRTPC